LNPKTITEISDVRVNYHLVAPNQLKTSNPNVYKISDNHYWHIELYDNNITDGDFRFLYDTRANQPDYNLLQGYTMNDFILLYRRSAAEDWKIHPSTVTGSNSTGMLTTTSLLSGEYTLAVGKNIVSVPSISLCSTISVYPNPTTGQLIIKNGSLTGSLPSGGKLSVVEVYDIYGRKLSHFTTRAVSGVELHDSQFTIDISHLANGVYFMKIDGKTVKIFLQKVR
jgi:hypothetical protein